MIAIFGLGNPDKKYEATRHNLGFDVINQWHTKHSDLFTNFTANQKFFSQIAEGSWEGEKILLVKPFTFMNLSGQAVMAIKSFYKLTNNNIWIIHDDLDLPPGRIKISIAASSGGHNGINSIIENLGEKDFVRFRLGIGRPKFFGSVSNYVLKPPANSELNKINEAKDKIIQAIETTLKQGIVKTQNIYNQ